MVGSRPIGHTPVVSATVAMLRKNQALGLAPPALLRDLAGRCIVRDYINGTRVVTVGSRQTHVLLIVSGALTLWRRGRAKSSMLVGMLRAPALLGDAELFTDSPWVVTLRAAEPTLLVQIPNQAFLSFIARDTKVAVALYRDASARHMLTIRLMQMFVLEGVGRRILRLLWTQAKPPTDSSGFYSAKVSHTGLGNALGVHRKTVARHVEDLEKAGFIARNKRNVLLLHDPIESAETYGFGASWGLPGRARR